MTAIYKRLAEYEDSGLTPEEVQKLVKAKAEGQLIKLPVPIGAPVYVPYRLEEFDGSISDGVEELHLSGYIKEGDREFYTTYDDEYGTEDVDPDELYASHEEAKKALEADKKRKCRVCGCTWDHACPGSCYWVEEDLCSRCAEKEGLLDG